MASKLNFQPYVTCGICTEYYGRPDNLPYRLPSCPHVFCHVCIDRIDRNDFKIKCPTCAKENEIPESGVESLILDVGLLSLVDERRCVDCRVVTDDIYKCSHCKVTSCQDCNTSHKGEPQCSILGKLRRIEQTMVHKENVKDELEMVKEKLTLAAGNHDDDVKQVNKVVKDLNLAMDERKTELEFDSAEKTKTMKKNLIDIADLLKTDEMSLKIIRKSLNNGDTDLKKVNEIVEKLDRVLLTDRASISSKTTDFIRTIQLCADKIKGQQTDEEDNVYRQKKIVQQINGTENNQDKFTDISDVAVCPQTGKIYVTEPNHIRVYTADYKFSKRFAIQTNSTINFITVNYRGEVLMANVQKATVHIFDSHGNEIRQFKTKYHKVNGITCDKEGTIYVIGFPSSDGIETTLAGMRMVLEGKKESKGCVVAVYRPDGTFVREFGKGTLSSAFLFIALNNVGRVLVSDTEADCFFVFTKEGKLIKSVYYGNKSSQGRKGLCVDEEGYVLVADHNNNSIRVFSPEPANEQYAVVIDSRLELQSIWGIAVTKSKDILVVDDKRNELLVYSDADGQDVNCNVN